ncbi:hypothetical protein BDQ17DRAFT_1544674 [Cyathus striatus]|nr:hypothetical protein BDQ17DRAFT_1544674 [Cyathus striatus]
MPESELELSSIPSTLNSSTATLPHTRIKTPRTGSLSLLDRFKTRVKFYIRSRYRLLRIWTEQHPLKASVWGFVIFICIACITLVIMVMSGWESNNVQYIMGQLDIRVCGSQRLDTIWDTDCPGIQPNPDIAGIGVRTAFYIQCFALALLLLFSDRYTISAFISVMKNELTLYHVNIVAKLQGLPLSIYISSIPWIHPQRHVLDVKSSATATLSTIAGPDVLNPIKLWKAARYILPSDEFPERLGQKSSIVERIFGNAVYKWLNNTSLPQYIHPFLDHRTFFMNIKVILRNSKVHRVILSMITVSVSIYEIERTISLNTVAEGENMWSYGQILATIMAVVPIGQLLQLLGFIPSHSRSRVDTPRALTLPIDWAPVSNGKAK